MENLNLITCMAFIAALTALLCFIIYLYARLRALQNRYEKMMGNMDGKNLEELFLARLQEIAASKDKISFLDGCCRDLDAKMSMCLQNVGVVRFNAFDDTGGDLSYAVALLDRQGDGVVLSGIYGRSEARCYAKPVRGGKSDYLLTAEEKQAIARK